MIATKINEVTIINGTLCLTIKSFILVKVSLNFIEAADGWAGCWTTSVNTKPHVPQNLESNGTDWPQPPQNLLWTTCVVGTTWVCCTSSLKLAPHVPQNWRSLATDVPHPGQNRETFSTLAPQLPQNGELGAISWLHLTHLILNSYYNISIS